MGIKILDVVALLKEVPEKHLSEGQVGTIVEDLGKNFYEVEFIDDNGETVALEGISAKYLLLLHYELKSYPSQHSGSHLHAKRKSMKT
ncbi:MAG: DUF4926 domain-containing protein [Ignavibacteria bacterium]